jgi:hypothetical protein
MAAQHEKSPLPHDSPHRNDKAAIFPFNSMAEVRQARFCGVFVTGKTQIPRGRWNA